MANYSQYGIGPLRLPVYNYVPPVEESSSEVSEWLGRFDIALTVLEIATEIVVASLIKASSIATFGTTAALIPLANMAIGLAFAGMREGLYAYHGQTRTTGERLFDFGMPVLGAGLSITSGAYKSYKITSNIKKASGAMETAFDTTKNMKTFQNALEGINISVSKIKDPKLLGQVVEEMMEVNTEAKMRMFARKYNFGQDVAEFLEHSDYADKLIYKSLKSLEKKGYKISKSLTSNKLMAETLGQLGMENVYKPYKKMIKEGLSPKDALRSAFSNLDSKELRKISKNANAGLSDIISSHDLTTAAFAENIVNGKYLGFLAKREPSNFQKILRRYSAGTRVIGKGSTARTVKLKDVMVAKHRKWYQVLNSREFYDNVARRVQWLKPTDAARDFAGSTIKYRQWRRFAYNKGKNFRTKYLQKLFNTLDWKSVFKKVKKFNDLKAAFVNSGGKALNSQWILGYKIINGDNSTPLTRLVQISFQPHIGKDGQQFTYNPVYVTTTDTILKEFRSAGSPGQFYLDQWANARNGIPYKGAQWSKLQSLFNVAGGLGSSLVPVQFLRTFTSITSTLTKTGNEMAIKGVGGWAKDYASDFAPRLVTQNLTRVGRIAGSYTGGITGSTYIRRETQRMINAVLSQTVSAGLKDGTTWTQAFQGIGGRVTTGLKTGAMTAVRRQGLTSYMSRRRSGSTFGSNVFMKSSWTRKARLVQRVPNSFIYRHSNKIRFF